MDEHKKFLADRLLSEEQPITYRLLSRALDVHVNTAKEMLYDFHKYQNALRANSVHATYLVYGTKSPPPSQGDGDVEMSSSMPEQEPLSEDIPTTTLTIVGEENLSGTLDEYSEVTSIHVYSLSPHPQRDLSLLVDVSRSLSEYSKQEDPSAAAQKYGVISNPNVRRRNLKGRPKATAATATKPVKQEPAPPKATQASKVKQEVVETSSKNTTPTSSAGKSSAPASKRGGAGGIMQSFAKAASKPQKPKPPVKKEEDSTMALSDDGEADEADMPQPKKKTEAEMEAIKNAKKQREEELRRMMEEDEEEDADEDDDEKEEEPADEEMEEAPEPEPEQDTKTKPGTKEEVKEEEVVATTENGRRRGKRRVMQKKRILDDQGYMVTIQEPGWESFSEDENPQPSKKATPGTTPASSAGSKAKKPAGKPGQGNIMSFFGKK